MRGATKALAFAGFLLSATAANAAVDLCRFIPYLPTTNMRFEQSAAGLDTLGCSPQPVASAHFKKWFCGAGSEQVVVILSRFVDVNVDMLTLSGDGITDLAGFRNCPERDRDQSSPGYNLTPRARTPRRSYEVPSFQTDSDTAGRPAFDPASIYIQDRMGVQVTPLGYRATVYLVGLAGHNIIVAGTPESSIDYSPNNPARIVENRLFGITRRDFARTSVEIAGQNLYTSSSDSIISALQSRGATIRSAETGPGVIKTVLSPPTGLEGVTSVEVLSISRHTLGVTYNIAALSNYQAFTALLTERYGQPRTSPGTGRTNRACRYRFWQSGVVSIAGETCPNQPFVINFLNEAISEQLRQGAAARPSQSRQPSIDPDNL